MSGRWRAWLGMLGSFLLVPVVVMAAASPAHACSCAMGETKDYVKWADAVFTGNLVEVDAPTPDEGELVSSGDDVTMVIAVDEVFKGEATAQVEVATARGGASCGITPPDGDGAWLWFVYLADDGSYAANLCGGSGPTNEATVAQVVDLVGPGARPEAEPAGEGGGDPSGSAGDGGKGDADGDAGDDPGVGANAGGDANDEKGSSAVPWAVGGGALLVVLLVVLLVRAVGAGAFVGRRRTP